MPRKINPQAAGLYRVECEYNRDNNAIWHEVHGRRLGLDFTDFMTRWSNLGCPGPEFYLLEPFHDRRQRLLRDSGPVVERWKAWIGGTGRGTRRPA